MIKAVDLTVFGRDVREEEQKEDKTGWMVETVVCVVMAILPSLVATET